MTRSHIAALLVILAASLGATACSAADSTGPRPAFKCESQGSNNVYC
jgi:hypothetical protein